MIDIYCNMFDRRECHDLSDNNEAEKNRDVHTYIFNMSLNIKYINKAFINASYVHIQMKWLRKYLYLGSSKFNMIHFIIGN